MKGKKFYALPLIIFLFPMTGIAADANAGPPRWEGAMGSGVLLQGDECPIEVEREELIFQALEFPTNYYESEEAAKAYDGTVTAKYTFYNGTEGDVTATLLFPFGEEPSYAYSVYDEETGGLVPFDDSHLREITVNGEEVEYTLRHSYYTDLSDFDAKSQFAVLSDTYLEDEFFTPDLPVTVYHMDFANISTSRFYATGLFSVNEEKTRYVVDGFNGFSVGEDGDFLRGNFYEGKSFAIIAFGEQIAEEDLPTFDLYVDHNMEQRVAGNAKLKYREHTNFKDFVLKNYYDVSSDVSEVDYYNAVLTSVKNMSKSYGGAYMGWPDIFNVSNVLMRWYEYEITVPAHGRVENAVKAPLYPDINLMTLPNTYEYEYLLSPAQFWASFGELQITVLTDSYLLLSSLEGFEKTDEGYALTLSTLPDGELAFSLCASENPEKITYRGGITFWEQYGWWFLTLGAGGLLIVGGIVFLAVWLKKRKGRKSDR